MNEEIQESADPAPAPTKPPLANDGRPLPPGARQALGGNPYPAPAPGRAAMPRHPRATPAAAPLFGNPTFDPPSEEITHRRQAIADVKLGVRRLIAEIERTVTGLQPQLENLSANSKEVKAKEDFDVKDVTSFLADLQGAVNKLSK